MRTLIVAFSVALFAGWGISAQSTSTAKKHASPSKSKSTKRKSTAKKPAATASSTKSAPATTSSTAHRRASSKTTKRTPAKTAVRRSTQQQPTPDRYKEIQQALAERGYFNGPVDGQWGPESVDALKRFQREQNLTEDGKIGSLSLIALGLGPKRPSAEPTPEKVQQQ